MGGIDCPRSGWSCCFIWSNLEVPGSVSRCQNHSYRIRNWVFSIGFLKYKNTNPNSKRKKKDHVEVHFRTGVLLCGQELAPPRANSHEHNSTPVRAPNRGVGRSFEQPVNLLVLVDRPDCTSNQSTFFANHSSQSLLQTPHCMFVALINWA